MQCKIAGDPPALHVNTLIASPLARGLFRHAIAESACFFQAKDGTKHFREAEEDGVSAMARKNALTLEAMRALPRRRCLKVI